MPYHLITVRAGGETRRAMYGQLGDAVEAIDAASSQFAAGRLYMITAYADRNTPLASPTRHVSPSGRCQTHALIACQWCSPSPAQGWARDVAQADRPSRWLGSECVD